MNETEILKLRLNSIYGKQNYAQQITEVEKQYCEQDIKAILKLLIALPIYHISFNRGCGKSWWAEHVICVATDISSMYPWKPHELDDVSDTRRRARTKLEFSRLNRKEY